MKLSGDVEIDGAYFGGYIKPRNQKENRRDRRLAMNQTGKRKVVVVMRERNGRTLPFVFKTRSSFASNDCGACRDWQRDSCRRSIIMGPVAREIRNEAD